MKQVQTMPTIGQFIKIINYDNNIWSSTRKWIDGELYSYDEYCDEFVRLNDNDHESLSLSNDIKYFIFDGEK